MPRMTVKRVFEPELMDEPRQVKAYSEADFSSSDENFVTDLGQYLSSIHRSSNSIGLIVDLGCGPGNISELLASRWPSAQILGIDGSREMLKVAETRKNEKKSRMDLKGLNYILSEISLIPFSQEFSGLTADVIVSNSLMHHLHDPKILWKAVKYLSSPGSVVFHRDLRRPLNPDRVSALQRKYFPNAPDILIHDYLASLHAAFTIEEVLIQLRESKLEHLNVVELEDRYLEVVGTL